MNRRLEWVLLGLILAVGAWLRFSQLDLLEFKSDEAVAAQLALKFVKSGELPLAGLMSSVGVTNPPLFIYLLIPAFFVTTSIPAVTCFIALCGLGAVAATWWVGRRYYGPVAGLVAAAFFAVSPWAVIYSRKLWAQDFVPAFAVGTIWAVHALCLGKKPRAIFWALFLPLCVIQIHFSGLALTATVVAVVLVLRPKVDWKWAGAAVVAAFLLMIPYLRLQSQNDWADFRKAAATVGGQKFNFPPGMTVHPDNGYALPSRAPWVQALAIMNAGQIEDILGLSARRELDRNSVWKERYFEETLTLGDWLPVAQRLLFIAALVWLVSLAFRHQETRHHWIVALWIAVPVGVFVVARLWTYLSYFVILYPAHYLALGIVADRLAAKFRWPVIAAVALLVAGNVVFANDLFAFLRSHRGAHGTYGTVLADKAAAAQYVAGLGDVKQLTAQARLWQVDRVVNVGQGQTVALADRAQLDLPFLAAEYRPAGMLASNRMVVVVDQNRVNCEPPNWMQFRTAVTVPRGGQAQLFELQWNRSLPVVQTNFGGMWIFVVQR